MKNLHTIEGTVAHELNKHMHEIRFSSLSQAKEDVIRILQSPEIKQQDLAKKYIVEIQRMSNMSHLMSTVVTYATGEKVCKTKKRTA